jgi:tRNA modification GTPase
VLTPSGRGAVAVIAASGIDAYAAVDAHFKAANDRPVAGQLRDRIVFGHWSTGAHAEEIILLRGEGDSLEIHCHGGAAAVARICDALEAAGCEILPWEQWLRETSTNVIEAEADIALAQATTRRTAAVLLKQRSGALSREILTVIAQLTRGDLAAARRSLNTMLARSAFGMHLTQPWQVAIAGRPNVGKSSLMNALVGYQRAIVFDQPGTTRDVLAADTAIDGWPVRLTDAAGIRATSDPLEAEGVFRAQENLARADLVLWLLDATALDDIMAAFTVADGELDETSAAAVKSKRLVVLNKIDKLNHFTPPEDAGLVCTSTVTQVGLDDLLNRIAERLVPAPPQLGEAVPFTQRQVDRLKKALAAVDAGDAAAASQRLRQLAGPEEPKD